MPRADAQLAPNFSSLHSFTGSDGGNPQSALTQGSLGNLYGTTTLGGANETGVVYELNAFNAVTPIHSFAAGTKDVNVGGTYPKGSLIEVGNILYGTAYSGGYYGSGTLFSVETVPTPSFASLYIFDPDETGNADGDGPSAGMIVGNDGAFYGTAYQGGAYDGGTIFRVTSDYVFVALYDFGHPRSDEGTNPSGSLIQTSDGYFYGTTSGGGFYGTGTIFQLTPQHVLHTLHSFSALDANGANADGANPVAGLVLGGGGYLYGTASRGGNQP